MSSKRSIFSAMRILLVVSLLTSLLACTEKPVRNLPVPIDYSTNYKYNPTIDSSYWEYQVYELNEFGDTVKDYIIDTYYDASTRRFNSYEQNLVKSYRLWANYNNQVVCCVDRVLVDFNQLGCQGDSVLVDQDSNSNIQIAVYQFCDATIPSIVVNYQGIKCIRTTQYNNYSDGSSLEIVRYFGYNVGLIYENQRELDGQGKVFWESFQFLRTHDM